jgi:hypothetical protein
MLQKIHLQKIIMRLMVKLQRRFNKNRIIKKIFNKIMNKKIKSKKIFRKSKINLQKRGKSNNKIKKSKNKSNNRKKNKVPNVNLNQFPKYKYQI